MGDVVIKLMESPLAPFILLGLFAMAYQSLKRQINGVGRKGNAIVAFMTESQTDEAKRQRLNDLLKG